MPKWIFLIGVFIQFPLWYAVADHNCHDLFLSPLEIPSPDEVAFLNWLAERVRQTGASEDTVKAVLKFEAFAHEELDYLSEDQEAKERAAIALDKRNRELSIIRKNGLTPVEFKAIRSYSSYGIVNDELRVDKAKAEETHRAFLGPFRSGLRKLPNYKGTVYRGESATGSNFDRVRAFFPGQIISWPHPVSTTKSEEFSETFGKIKYVIRSRTGKDISILGVRSYEEEVVFQEGTQFKIISISRPDLNKENTTVEIEELPEVP